MRAAAGVIDQLNRVLTHELTAINQYFLHAEMCHHWGYDRLYHKLRAFSIDEMKDVEVLIEHILVLEGLPNVQRLGTVGVGESAEEHLRLDLTQEQSGAQVLKDAISHCDQAGDYVTRHLLNDMLAHQLDSIAWLESQMETIGQVGIQNYLTEQIRE